MLGSPVQKPTLHRSIGTKVLLAEGEDTPFAEHCRHYEDSYRVSGPGGPVGGKGPPLPHGGAGPTSRPSHPGSQLSSETPRRQACRAPGAHGISRQHLQAEMQSLKDQVQELHRDLTKHHSLIKAEIMADILRKALQVDAQIGSEYASVEGMRAAFQEMWEESYQRVADEQEIYEGPRQPCWAHPCPGANPCASEAGRQSPTNQIQAAPCSSLSP
ncbi:PREDICTED: RING finger protein 207-like isoform X1 [Myotis brandtii]|uniref:RING finger protein 207-like isoform X1 n=1 Tax=Myotis brandtii TaxID=109478 RepID=UPI000703E2FF|nr:PREDICTED: RING finger protein 207-like isoform X1 [Myotis brandtii]